MIEAGGTKGSKQFQSPLEIIYKAALKFHNDKVFKDFLIGKTFKNFDDEKLLIEKRLQNIANTYVLSGVIYQ